MAVTHLIFFSMTFTPEEDAIILEFVQQPRRSIMIPWHNLLPQLPGKTIDQICRRYHTVLKKEDSSAPVIVADTQPAPRPHKSYTAEEDKQILEWAKNHNEKDWLGLSKQMPARHSSSLSARYQTLKQRDQNNEPLTDEEKFMLVKAVSELGRRWSLITKCYFPTRCPITLKNAYEKMTKRPEHKEFPLPQINDEYNDADLPPPILIDEE